MKAEQEIDKKTWLVDLEELKSRKGKFNDSFMSKSHLMLNQDGSKVSANSSCHISLIVNIFI